MPIASSSSRMGAWSNPAGTRNCCAKADATPRSTACSFATRSPALASRLPPRRRDCIFDYAVGIDLTRRDLQIASRDMKRPGEIGKAFDASAPCGPLQPAARIGHPSKGRIALKVNGKVRQDGDLAQMIWNVPEVIVKLSEMVALAPGDMIMTGTPSGVAATVAGDKLECEVEGVGKLSVTVGPALK